MLDLHNLNKSIVERIFPLIILIIFLYIFFLEFFYFLPSPTGDDLWFLKLSFNICRDNLFVSTNHSIFEINAKSLEWTTHGWFNQYVMAKLNFNCSLRGIFIFSLIIKVFSSLLVYSILKDKKINSLYIYLLILLILAIQLKLQFRPETFTIFLYLLLIFSFFKNYFLIVGIIQATIFFTQPTIFVLVSLFGIILYFKEFKQQYKKIIFGFFLSSICLLYIYPYSIFEYIHGLWEHKSALKSPYSLLEVGDNYTYFKYLETYYLKTNFLPFFGILFLYIYLFLIFRKKLILITIPFIIFFGPITPSANYILISLTPLLLILLLCIKDILNSNPKYLNYLFILTLIVSTLGLSQYFLRNTLTAMQFGDEINKTKKFLLKNKDEILIYPGFSFMLDKDFKYVSLGNANADQTNFHLKIFSANGSRINCKSSKNIDDNTHQIKIFSRKIFNSNSGYGIRICN